MIWPAIWPFVLAVVYAKWRGREKMYVLLSESHKRRYDLHERPYRDANAICSCEECVSWFEPHLRWTQIR